MTNRATRRAGRRARQRPNPGGSKSRRAGLRLLVLVAVVGLVILALASTQFAAAPAVTPGPTF